MELRLKTLVVVLTAVIVIAAGSCVPSTPTPTPPTSTPIPTDTPAPTPTPSVPVPCVNDPAFSKADPILQATLVFKNQASHLWPEGWRHELERPIIGVGVRTSHELTDPELDAVRSKTGVTLSKSLEWPDGTVSYGAAVAWEQICPLLELPDVVRMTTGFNPYILLPSTGEGDAR